jgi:hypothetical protein
MSTVAQIRVKLLADLAELDRMKSQANAAFREVNRAASREMREAKGSMMLLGDEIGIRLPRHLQTFVAKLPGVASAMSAAFDTIAVIALIDIVVKAGEKIAEFVEKNKKAAEELAKAQEAVGQAGERAYRSLEDKALSAQIKIDELTNNHLAKLHDELELIDHQSFDSLESAFDTIAQKSDEAFSKIKADWLSTVLSLGMVNNATPGFQASLGRLKDQVSGQVATGDYAGARKLVLDYQAQQASIHDAAQRVLALPFAQRNNLSGVSDADLLTLNQAGIVANDPGALQTAIQSSSTASNAAGQMGRIVGADWRVNSDEHQVKLLEDQKAQHGRATEVERKVANEFIKNLEHALKIAGISDDQKPGWWLEHLGSAPNQLARQLLGDKAIDSYTPPKAEQIDTSGIEQEIKWQIQQAKDDAEAWAKAVKYARTVLEDQLADVKTKSGADLDAIKYDQATGNIGRHEAALQTAAVHQEQYRAFLDALIQAESKGVDVSRELAQLETQHNAQVVEDALATRDAFDQMFDHIREGAQDVEQKIASIMEHTLDGLNDQFVNAMFGDRTNFGKVFEQSERSLAKVSLQWIEGTLLGKGKDSKGKINELQLSATNGALNVHIAGSSVTSGSGSGGSSDASPSGRSIFSSIPGVSKIEDSFKNSSFGQWVHQNAGKYMPGAMDMAGGLMGMFQGPQHTKGEGSGVANALSDANYRQNNLSRWLMGFGQIAKGAGSMMFAGAGGMQGLNDSDAAGSLFGGRLFGPGGIFGGGVPIEVGEVGPEIWTPPTSGGHITPNRDIAGGSPTYVIDARATDPALTQANVARAIASSNAHAVEQAQSRMIDRQRRTPR